MNFEKKGVFGFFLVSVFSQTQFISITIVNIKCARADTAQLYSVRAYSYSYPYIIPAHDSSFLKQLLVDIHLNAPIAVCL